MGKTKDYFAHVRQLQAKREREKEIKEAQIKAKQNE